MNDERKAVFEERIDFRVSDAGAVVIKDMRQSSAEDLVTEHIPPKAFADQWDIAGLKEELKTTLGLDLTVEAWTEEEGIADEDIIERIHDSADKAYAEKAANHGQALITRRE